MARLLAERRVFLQFLERQVGDPHLAEDILQESWTKALEHVGSIRSEAVEAWFYRVLRNAVIDRRRRSVAANRRLRQFAQQQEHPPQFDPAPANRACKCARALVDTLKPEYAVALKEVDLAGTSLAGYAEKAGITPNNAGVRVHRARKALRKKLLGYCRRCAESGCVDCTCQAPRDEASG